MVSCSWQDKTHCQANNNNKRSICQRVSAPIDCRVSGAQDAAGDQQWLDGDPASETLGRHRAIAGPAAGSREALTVFQCITAHNAAYEKPIAAGKVMGINDRGQSTVPLAAPDQWKPFFSTWRTTAGTKEAGERHR